MKKAKRLPQVFVSLLTAFAIFLVTFPRFVPDYGTGLDPSYVWAINFLVVNNYDALTSLVYPIGPFGFLKYTVAFEQNLFAGILFFSLVKLLFIFLLFRLSDLIKGKITGVNFAVVLLVSLFSGLDFALIGSTVVLLLLSLQKPSNRAYFIIANILAFLGLSIKSSIGIAAYSAIFSYMVYRFFIAQREDLKKLALLTIMALMIFVLGGLLVFRGFGSFYHFVTGLFHLAGGYSSALALFPDNNWWLLTGFIISVLIFPFSVKSANMKTAYLLLLLPLFAIWKHAMGREDISHIYVLFTFLFSFWGIIFLYAERIRFWHFIFPLLSFIFIDANNRHVHLHRPFDLNLNGVANFSESVINFPEFNSKYKTISEQNISKNKFGHNISVLIGKDSVDVYPWDLSYVPANGLNWKPRTTLELGAANTRWLSGKNAQCFESETGPEFVILHLQNDKWGGTLGTLDGRYLLNDEPQLVFNFLKNYTVVKKDARYLLLQKSTSSLSKATIKTEKAEWNSWIKVPDTNQHTRLKFNSHRTFLLRLKSFLYKDEAFYIDYRLQDGRILSYRFVASTAADGLWINPLVLNPEKDNPEPKVTEVRFRCSNTDLMQPEIVLEWETINVDIQGYFRKTDSASKTFLFKKFENFESVTNALITREYSYSGHQSGKILPGDFSSSVKVALDTLWQEGFEQLEVKASLMYFSQNTKSNDAVLVISVQNSNNDFWRSFPLKGNEMSADWNYGFLNGFLNREDHQKGDLSIYVWNNGSSPIYIDDFSLTVGDD